MREMRKGGERRRKGKMERGESKGGEKCGGREEKGGESARTRSALPGSRPSPTWITTPQPDGLLLPAHSQQYGAPSSLSCPLT